MMKLISFTTLLMLTGCNTQIVNLVERPLSQKDMGVFLEMQEKADTGSKLKTEVNRTQKEVQKLYA